MELFTAYISSQLYAAWAVCGIRNDATNQVRTNWPTKRLRNLRHRTTKRRRDSLITISEVENQQVMRRHIRGPLVNTPCCFLHSLIFISVRSFNGYHLLLENIASVSNCKMTYFFHNRQMLIEWNSFCMHIKETFICVLLVAIWKYLDFLLYSGNAFWSLSYLYPSSDHQLCIFEVMKNSIFSFSPDLTALIVFQVVTKN